MKRLVILILISAAINFSYSQAPAPGKTEAQNIQSIQVPQLNNKEVQNFLTIHHSRLIIYLRAVRQNNKPEIKAAFDKDVADDYNGMVKMLEKARAGGAAEYDKTMAYLKQTRPFLKEISQHPYVIELSKAYLKKTEKN